MKARIKYNLLRIHNKLAIDFSIVLDTERDKYPLFRINHVNENVFMDLNLNPFIQLSILRFAEDGSFQTQQEWNPSDHLSLTKATFPIFLHNLNGILKDFEIPKLYSYRGSRLELNESEAKKVHRSFLCGRSTVVMDPTVITQDDTYYEGMRLMFNGEGSIVLLPIDDIRTLAYTFNALDIHTLAIQLYQNYLHQS